MAKEKWQRRHYETIARGLKAKRASGANVDSEVASWISKFAADNPRFRADFFRGAIYGGTVSIQTRQRGGRTITREYRERSIDRPGRVKPFKTPKLDGYRTKTGRCKFGKIKRHGRKVCRRSPRRK